MTSLDRLFDPGSACVVGASEDAGKYGGKCLRFLLDSGYRGRLSAVHPTASTVQGVPAVPDLASLDHVPDVVIVAAPARFVLPTLRQASARGIRRVIVFGSGFAEAGAEGRRLQDEIVDLCRRDGIALVGPNTVGLVGPASAFVASFAGALSGIRLPPGNVAMISQSGALMGALFAMAVDRGLGLRGAVSPGNGAVLGFADYVEHFAADDGCRVILLAVEGVTEGARLAAACRSALEAGKRVVVLKSGRSEKGRQVALSHTANLAGDDAVFDAYARRNGLLRVRTLTELLDVGLACSLSPAGDRPGVGVFTGSGGAGVLLADAAEDLGLDLPPFASATAGRLRDLLPPFAALDNPLDVTAELNRRMPAFLEALEVFASDPAFGGVVIMRGQIEPERAHALAAGVGEVRRRVGKPIVMLWLGDRSLERPAAELAEAGVPVYRDPAAAMAAMRALLPPGKPRPAESIGKRGAVGDETGEAAAPGVWPEWRGKARLRQAGLPVPRGELARSAAEAAAFADTTTQPLAMKAQSAALVHKTDAGGVRLGVPPASSSEAWTAMRARFPGALDGILVEEMVAVAAEIIVGLRRDPILGDHAVIGPGGVMAELFADPLVTMLPATEDDLDRLYDHRALGPLLRGFRGAPGVSRARLTDFLARLTAVFQDSDDGLAELEVNPAAITAEGELVVLDVAFIWRDGCPRPVDAAPAEVP